MLAPHTFTAQWFRAVRERHRQAKVLFWWPFWTLVVLLAIAFLIDQPVSEAMQQWPDAERAFFRAITDLGKSDWLLIPTLITGLIAGAALWMPLRYSWRWAMRGTVLLSGYIFATIAISGLATVLLKRIFGRARPMYIEDYGVLNLRPFEWLDWSFHSFPSGHTTTAVALAVILRTFTNGRYHGWIIGFGLAIGMSRIVVGDHYLSDVIAGAFVGLTTAIVIRDYFVTRNWGLRVINGRVHCRMFKMFSPLLRWLRRGHIPALLK